MHASLVKMKTLVATPEGLENNKGYKKRFRIVGYHEIFDTKDYYLNRIQLMAQAPMKKEVGDEVVVKTNAGEFVLAREPTLSIRSSFSKCYCKNYCHRQ